MRKGDYINTYKSVKFYPFDPIPEEIVPEDIAHALSQVCRAGGHLKSFYTIAQHSLNCMREAKKRGYSPRVQLACLLHDASEAYIADITRPVKKHLPQYLELEKNIEKAIWKRFSLDDLTEDEYAKVWELDTGLLAEEFYRLQHGNVGKRIPLLSRPDFRVRRVKAVEHQFLRELSRLQKEISQMEATK